jgi:enoyl-CoA hydratase
MSLSFETLLLETEESICTLTINRPDKLNALNSKVLDELEQAFNHIQKSSDIRGVILTGAGEKAFVAGADIKELSSLNGQTGAAASERGQRVFSLIENSSKPVIAVVNGYALGGGTELALSAHIRIASANAVFGLPEVSLGLIPGYGGTQRLTRLLGKGKALELILTGRMVKVDEALSLGIVNDSKDSIGEANIAAIDMLKTMFRHGPVALAAAIKAVNASEANKSDGYSAEAREFGNLCETRDFKEGTGAFLEKRKPEFTGN